MAGTCRIAHTTAACSEVTVGRYPQPHTAPYSQPGGGSPGSAPAEAGKGRARLVRDGSACDPQGMLPAPGLGDARASEVQRGKDSDRKLAALCLSRANRKRSRL